MRLIIMWKKKLKKWIDKKIVENNNWVDLEIRRYIEEQNDDGQDYIKGYGDGYSRALKDIFNAIEQKKIKQGNPDISKGKNIWRLLENRFQELKKDLEIFQTRSRGIIRTLGGTPETAPPLTTNKCALSQFSEQIFSFLQS